MSRCKACDSELNPEGWCPLTSCQYHDWSQAVAIEDLQDMTPDDVMNEYGARAHRIYVPTTDIGCVAIESGFELYVVKCLTCGFDLGLDATYLANHSIDTKCPNCQNPIHVEEIE